MKSEKKKTPLFPQIWLCWSLREATTVGSSAHLPTPQHLSQAYFLLVPLLQSSSITTYCSSPTVPVVALFILKTGIEGIPVDVQMLYR